ncbi:MAG: hypothetical protein M3007_06130 [Candidatus Eremiobacteraeota bacterium]|nr:hypothetical protein [Candidatus Eremiobacteraeota bacterium]
MKRLSPLFFLILSLTAVQPVACVQQAQPPEPVPPKPLQVIWAGTSGGHAIRWTTKEISANSNPPSTSRPMAFSDTGLTILDFSEAGNRQTGNCDFQRLSSVLSVVGPWLSVQHADEMRCGAAQAAQKTQALAIDLDHPQKRPLLTDIFPEHAVLVGLEQATPLKNTLAALHTTPPTTAAALVTLLANSKAVCQSAFPKDFLNRFAFAQVRGDQVLVRVGLPSDCKASEVTLWLPIPRAQIHAFELAAKNSQGFLLAHQPAIAKGRATTVLYHVRTSGASQ